MSHSVENSDNVDHSLAQDEEATIYKGWVPNVAGRLSFSFFGYTQHPTRAIVANVSDTRERYILCYQKRVLVDGVLPLKEIAARLFFGLDGRFWFVCLGRADDRPSSTTSTLTGHLFLFHVKNTWRSEVEPLVRNVQSYLRDYERNNVGVPLHNHCAKEYNNLLRTLQARASFYSRFTVDRDGEAILAPPAIEALPEDSPRFPEDPGEQRATLHNVLSQLYFFLRDIGHVHQHHNPRTDTIVDLHECQNGDDYLWRCETLRCLYRKVLEFKRIKRDDVFSSSLGVLAYATSFRRSSDSKLQALGLNKKVEPTIYVDCLTDSITANQSQIAGDIATRMRRSEAYRSTLIATLTFLFALTGLLRLSGGSIQGIATPNPILLDIANLLLAYPVEILFAMPAVLLAFLQRAGLIDAPNWAPFRLLLKLFQVIGKKKAAIVAIFSGIAIGVLTFYFFAPGLIPAIVKLLVSP
jgi:hypothetical protein